jgi:hypothetical protein
MVQNQPLHAEGTENRVYDKKIAVAGWHGQTRSTMVVPMAPAVQEDTLKLRLGVPPMG